jgi:plastocyanin
MKKLNITLQLIMVCCFCSIQHLAVAGEIQISIKDSKGNMLEDAIVTAMPTNPKNIPKQKNNKPIVDQVDKEFIPHVMPVYVGSLVSFPNNDNIRHHVYSFSPAKKFELPLYSGSSAPPVLFDKPGVVILGCNIHDWMLGYIYVSETPYFVRSAQDGKGLIRELPEGEYIVKVWHPLMTESEESTARRIVLSDNKASKLEWQLSLKRAFKLPRNTVSRGFGY